MIHQLSPVARARRRRPRRWATDGSPEPLVRADRRALVGLLPAGGVRLRRRHVAAVPAARRRSARRHVRVDRAGLGRQRGLAGDGGRRHLRGVPGVVCHDVLESLHRASGRALLPDHPRDLVRVEDEEREPALAEGMAVGERGRELRRLADLGRRVREPVVRHPDQLQRRLRRIVLGPVQRLHPAGGARGRCHLRVPRCHLPHAAHPGGSAGTSRPRLATVVGGRGGARCRVPDLDGEGCRRPKRQERLSAGAARGDRDRRARACGRPRPPAQPDLGVRDDRPGHDRARGHALCQPVSRG